MQERSPGVGGISRSQATALAELVRQEQPSLSLETGFSHGMSTVFICSALGAGSRHIVIDPYQRTLFRGAGLRNVVDAGFGEIIDFREESSHTALPALEAERITIDFAFIDSSHEFDLTMIELFYIDRMLKPGGLVVLDDTPLRNVRQVVRYAVAAYGYSDLSRPARTRRWRRVARRLRRLARGLLAIPQALRFAVRGERSELFYCELPWPRENDLAVLRKPLEDVGHVDWRVDIPM
jgi:predicted O-methyltransferase YrrM